MSSSFTNVGAKCSIKNLSNSGTIIVKCRSNTGDVEIARFKSSGIELQFLDQMQKISYTPTGTILAFAGFINNTRPNNNLPTGYLWCNGTAYDTTSYSRLFNVIGYTYGGSGSNFNVPDLRRKFLLGAGTKNSMNVDISLNGTTQTSIVGGNSKITINQMASHKHGISFNTNTYMSAPNTANNTGVGGNIARLANSVVTNFPTQTNSTGATTLDDYMPPWTSIQYIIKY